MIFKAIQLQIASINPSIILGINQLTYKVYNAPKIAKLVYDSDNYGLYIGDICIVNGVYKPTYN